MINPELNLGRLSNGVARLRIPVSAVSIGVQGEVHQLNYNLLPETMNFLKLLSEKCVSFGVRGKTAARFLEQIGTKNFRIIGCPSNFINFDYNLGLKAATDIKPIRDVVVHHELLQRNEHIAVSNKIASLRCQDIRMKFLVQSPIDFIRLARKTKQSPFKAQELNFLSNTFGWDGIMDPLRFVRDYIGVYFSMDDWLDGMRRYDFSVGMRLHGNIVALQAGVPSLIVFHDERTRELAETLAIPNIDVSTFVGASSYQYLAERHLHLLIQYDIVRMDLALEYYNLLLENGLSVSSDLTDFALRPAAEAAVTN